MITNFAEWRRAREAKVLADRYRNEAPRPPAGLQIPRTFGYIHFKAFRYLAHGPVKYRHGDHFHLPPADWPPELFAVVKLGCLQIVRWNGLSAEVPLQDLGIDGFYALLYLFHFKLKSQAAFDGGRGFILDQMQMEHVVDGRTITLFNRVEGTGRWAR